MPTERLNLGLHDEPAHQRITIGDLARQLGLSQSSVSAALNDRPGVSESTRQRVKKLAASLDWYPHAGARALRTRRSRTLGLILTREPEELSKEPFYYFIIAGIERALRPDGYTLLLRMVGRDSHLAIYRKWHEEQLVDGFILFDLLEEDERIALLGELGAPTLVAGEKEPAPTMLQVAYDVNMEAHLIIEHLASLGHRRVTYVSGPRYLHHEHLRIAALGRDADRHGIDLQSIESDYSLEAAQMLATGILTMPKRPSAVIAGNDLMAFGVISAAREIHLSIPSRLSVVSWDDSLPGQIITPPLTALYRDPFGTGVTVGRMLVDQLEGRSHRTRALAPAPTLIVRGTTGIAATR